ncbi:MAG: hypothetical protein COA96_15135 [SAR86 cluster bacterium]|uniref:Isoprenylcysteine carboxylmethyltransferase family protein n=1 Tax=SAR86 cluster bacterium TaxID=2030880 RepID=A0A2A5AR94_9GAMM|nr:MAG: hypothetical protein COA96_15135 [SAR86 cluster bacterium]
MTISTTHLVLVFTFIVIVLMWARVRIFTIQSSNSMRSSWIYDPIVTIHIVETYRLLVLETDKGVVTNEFSLFLYALGFSLFLWSICTTRTLHFAFGENSEKILTKGPFAVVRHPFYLSYIIIWSSSSLLFNSIILWFTLTFLVAFYICSAMNEEKVILASDNSKEYRKYRKNVGMFIPRIELWKK